MTASEAFNGLVTIVGGGGLVSLIVAFLAYKKEAEKGRIVNVAPALAAAGQATFNGAPQAKDLELLTHAITGLTGVLIRQTELLEENAEKKERERELRQMISDMRGEEQKTWPKTRPPR